MECDPAYPICDRCGSEFERYDYDPYLEAFGHDPIIDLLDGKDPNSSYVICPTCQGELEGWIVR